MERTLIDLTASYDAASDQSINQAIVEENNQQQNRRSKNKGTNNKGVIKLSNINTTKSTKGNCQTSHTPVPKQRDQRSIPFSIINQNKSTLELINTQCKTLPSAVQQDQRSNPVTSTSENNRLFEMSDVDANYELNEPELSAPLNDIPTQPQLSPIWMGFLPLIETPNTINEVSRIDVNEVNECVYNLGGCNHASNHSCIMPRQWMGNLPLIDTPNQNTVITLTTRGSHLNDEGTNECDDISKMANENQVNRAPFRRRFWTRLPPERPARHTREWLMHLDLVYRATRN